MRIDHSTDTAAILNSESGLNDHRSKFSSLSNQLNL